MTDQAKKAMDGAKIEALSAFIEANMPAERRKAEMIAKVRRVHYEASIRQGFSAEEALHLCMYPDFDQRT